MNKLLLLLPLIALCGCRRPEMFGRRFASEAMENRYRAVTIPINGYELRIVRPGDRVDVLATFDSTGAAGKKMMLTATVLQNVRVLGVERPRRGEEKGSLVLKLNPNEAQYAALGVKQSDLSIALRAKGDDETYPMEMATFLKFFR